MAKLRSKHSERILVSVREQLPGEVKIRLTDDLRHSDHCWPTPDYGPVTSRTWIDGDLVNAIVVDRHSTVLTFSPVPT